MGPTLARNDEPNGMSYQTGIIVSVNPNFLNAVAGLELHRSLKRERRFFRLRVVGYEEERI